MSKIFQMQSVPILNSTDFYQFFDLFDILRDSKAFFRFAKGHFCWKGNLHLHHLDMLSIIDKDDSSFQMTNAADYWTFCGDWTNKLLRSMNEEKDIPEYRERNKLLQSMDNYKAIPEYQEQEKIAASIYNKYVSTLTGEDQKIILLVIASILLAEQDESYLNHINAGQLKAAYHHTEPASLQNKTDDLYIFDVSINETNQSIHLPTFRGVYRFFVDSSLQPSYENRMQTVWICADAAIKLKFVEQTTGETEERTLLAGECISCLVLQGTIQRILPNRVSNGNNTLVRKIDGIYLNDQKCFAIPPDASSFAVSADEIPQYLYVKDGHICYANYNNWNGRQKVSEEIAVISEVSLQENTLRILRNDGKYWDGRKFC